MCVLLYLTAVEETHDAVGLLGLLLVVGHHDDCALVLLVELVEQLHHLGTHLRVKVTGGLVGKDYLGISHDGTRNCHALALTSRKLSGHVTHAMAKSHAFKHLAGHAVAVASRHFTIKQRQLHIVNYVERINEVEALEHKAQLLVAECCKLLILHILYQSAIDFNGSACGRVEKSHDIEECRLDRKSTRLNSSH